MLFAVSSKVDGLGFIGNSEYPSIDEYYNSQLFEIGKYMGLKKLASYYNFTASDITNVISNYIQNLTDYKGTKILTFTTFQNKADAQSLITALKTNTLTVKTIVVYGDGGITWDDIQTISDNDGNMMLMGYSDTFDNEDKQIYDSYYRHSTDTKTPEYEVYQYIYIYLIINSYFYYLLFLILIIII